MDITPTTFASLSQQHYLFVISQIGDMLTGVVIHDQRADRHTQENIVCALAIAIGAAAVLAIARLVQLGIAIVDQGVDITVGHRPDGAALATIAAIGATEWTEFFTAKTGYTIATITGNDFDFCFVDKLHDFYR